MMSEYLIELECNEMSINKDYIMTTSAPNYLNYA